MEMSKTISPTELAATKCDELEGHVVPKKFKEVVHAKFRAEFHIEDNQEDVIIHFWPAESNGLFPPNFSAALGSIGESHFGATYPRVSAGYYQELSSWWLKAVGYPLLSLEHFVLQFLQKLQDELSKTEYVT